MTEKNAVLNVATEVEEINFYDPEKSQIDLDGLASVSKETKKSMAKIDDGQIRIIIDTYYQTQAHRKALANQIREYRSGRDSTNSAESIDAIEWLLLDVTNRENQIKKMIAEYVKNVDVCRWAEANKGIGPVFAANLLTHIDMSKCKHANQFLSYAGLNDNNVPWLGKDKATKLMDEIYKDLNMKDSDKANFEVFQEISKRTNRTVHNVNESFKRHKKKDTHNYNDKTILIKWLSMPPYNTELKSMCYLIGESFCKNANRGSYYGELYKERKALETIQNENLAYSEQAKRELKEKNYSKDTDTYKYLIQGKLSPAHIDRRAKRWATKIFLTHFFEACWIYTHGTKPPVIYPIAHMDHVDRIEPEVPFEKFIKYRGDK